MGVLDKDEQTHSPLPGGFQLRLLWLYQVSTQSKAEISQSVFENLTNQIFYLEDTSFFTANHFFEVLDVSLHGTSCQTVLSLSAPLRTTSLPMRTTTSTSPSSTRRRLLDAQAAPCHADTGSTHWPNPVPLLRHSCRLVVSCSGTPPPTWWRRRRSSSSPSSPWSVSWGELLVFSWDFPSLAFLILHLFRFPLQLASLRGWIKNIDMIS